MLFLIKRKETERSQTRNVKDQTGSQETDVVFYKRGNEFRRQGDWKRALECYAEAIALNPQSPAVEARQLLMDILDFRNPDMYNP